MSGCMQTARDIFSYRKHWAERFGTAPFLPMSRAEMDELGWDSCDVILVTGDAYVDHPSFGMAHRRPRCSRRRASASASSRSPTGTAPTPFARARPAEAVLRHHRRQHGLDGQPLHGRPPRPQRRRLHARTASAASGPIARVIVYAQRAREAFRDVPIVIGGIEASLRRIAHYDYWSDKVRRSVLLDAQGRPAGVRQRRARRSSRSRTAWPPARRIDDITRPARHGVRAARRAGKAGSRSTRRTSMRPGRVESAADPYAMERSARQRAARDAGASAAPARRDVVRFVRRVQERRPRAQRDPHARATSRCARTRCCTRTRRASCTSSPTPATRARWCSATATHDVWLNPPPIPLTTQEMDCVYELPYQRARRIRATADAKIPAYEMIRFSVAIQRGCFGGCTFCSITEHEGRIIQSRSRGLDPARDRAIRDTVPGFTGVISDLGGPTANMYRLACKSREIESACRRPSCVYPGICPNLNTDHAPLITLYRKARALPGHQEGPDRLGRALRPRDRVARVREGARAAPHRRLSQDRARGASSEGPLSKMMKPGVGAYDRFKELFDRYSKEAGKEQYLIPYFIAAHPGTTDEDMLELALWLKQNGFRADQVQAFLPAPMATATAMYHSGKNPLRASRATARRCRSRRASRCAACTRRSCAITIRTTGRCCARRCGAWGAPT